jgi:hypothetical protein
VFNILASTNSEIISYITHLAVNAYMASRALNMPPIDPSEHFEHREAKLTIGLFDGPVPTPEDFDALREMAPEDRPRYYQEIIAIVHDILFRFSEDTGLNILTDELTIRDRGYLMAVALDAVQLVQLSPEADEDDDDDEHEYWREGKYDEDAEPYDGDGEYE